MKFIFFSNGSSACFGKDNKQVSKYHADWFEVFLEQLTAKGINVEKQEFELPNGRTAIPFKTENGYNWRIK